MYKYTITVYLCKTEPLRMRYLGRSSCLEENTRFLILNLYDIEYQLSVIICSPMKSTREALHKQLDKQNKIYDYLQAE